MAIPDYTDAQVASVQNLLAEQYGEAIETHLADAEARLAGGDDALNSCPVLFWNTQNCNFAILRLEKNLFRAQYFYTPDEQYSTTQKEFNTLEDCVKAVIRTQANHQRELEVAASDVAIQNMH